MTRHNVPLGRILGIPIGLDYSWFVIFALLTWMLASSCYPAAFSDWPPPLYWFLAALTAIISTHCAAVPSDLTLQRLVDDHILASGQRCSLVNRCR